MIIRDDLDAIMESWWEQNPPSVRQQQQSWYADGCNRVAPTAEQSMRSLVRAIAATYPARAWERPGTAANFWYLTVDDLVRQATDTRTPTERMRVFQQALADGEAEADRYR